MGAGDVARHEIFVGLDLALAVLLVVRPRWALAPTAMLTAQQIWSHGSNLLDSTQGPGPFDAVSALVVVFFPALLALLVVERRAHARARTQRGDLAPKSKAHQRPDITTPDRLLGRPDRASPEEQPALDPTCLSQRDRCIVSLTAPASPPDRRHGTPATSSSAN